MSEYSFRAYSKIKTSPPPFFLIVQLFFVFMTHSGAWYIFRTVLTVSTVTGITAFHALAQCQIIFAGCFSVFCHVCSPFVNGNHCRETRSS